MPLSDHALEALQTALLELYEERDLASFRASAPEIVLRALPGDYFVWTENGFTNLDEPLRNLELWEHPVRLTPRSTKRLMALLPEHPFTLHAQKTGDWGPVKLSDFWTDAQLKASALWRDVYRKHGTGRLLACALFRGNRMCSINVSRQLSDPDFTERDRLVMKLLTPHFALAYQAAERVTALRDGDSRPLSALGLTTREEEVALWLARGRTNPEIATILAMQPRTVEKHVERILLKLGVENRTGAAMVISGQVGLPHAPQPLAGPPARGKGTARRVSARPAAGRTPR